MPHILHYWPSVNLPTCYLAFFGNNLKTSSGGDGGECHGHHSNYVQALEIKRFKSVAVMLRICIREKNSMHTEIL